MMAFNSVYLEEVASSELCHVDLACPGAINRIKYSLNHLRVEKGHHGVKDVKKF